MQGKLRYFILSAIIAFSINSCTPESEDPISIEEQLLELVENSSLDKNVLLLNGIQNNKIDYSIKDGFEFAFSGKAPAGEEICRGTGFSFGRCLRNALDSGLCLLTYRDGDEYVAEEMDCPTEDSTGQAP
jgi:hypothetical protein